MSLKESEIIDPPEETRSMVIHESWGSAQGRTLTQSSGSHVAARKMATLLRLCLASLCDARDTKHYLFFVAHTVHGQLGTRF